MNRINPSRIGPLAHAGVTQDKIRAAFQRGRSDCEKGRGVSNVPYSNAAMAQAWERGFTYARERKRGKR